MLGLLRLLTNKRVMRGAPLRSDKAWKAYQAFATLPEICFLEDTPSVEQQFAHWTSRPDFAAHLWTDAWIAAAAHVRAARVVSEILPAFQI